MDKRTRRTISLAALLAIPLGMAGGASALTKEGADWTRGYSLILTAARNHEEAHQAVDLIASRGGQVALVVSPRLMLGWVPEAAERELYGQAGILAIRRQPVGLAELAEPSLDEADSLRFFNQVVSGDWARMKSAAAPPPLESDLHDAIEPRPGGTPEVVPSTSELMVGKVSYNVIFTESDGTVEPSYYTWTCADLTTMVSEISAGLSFWSSRAANYGVPLTFTITYYRPVVAGTGGCAGTANVLTSYEPVLHNSTEDTLWISQIMCKFGYCVGTRNDRVGNFNVARRDATDNNYATTLFVSYNPFPAATQFFDGRTSYAVRGGPYAQALFRSGAWLPTQFDQVASHETGHLFGAFDEATSTSAPCTNCTAGDAISKSVVNGNCANASCNPSSVPCMMRGYELDLCGYTPGQIGWGLDINWVRVVRPDTGMLEKTNWVPGQMARFAVNLDLPGKPLQCIDIASRWYRQFQSNVAQVDTFDQPCALMAGTNQTLFIDRVIPTTAQTGEASFEVQLEAHYATPNKYGKGVRSSARGRFFVLTAGARASASKVGSADGDDLPACVPGDQTPAETSAGEGDGRDGAGQR